jgi:hypothetical protein
MDTGKGETSEAQHVFISADTIAVGPLMISLRLDSRFPMTNWGSLLVFETLWI